MAASLLGAVSLTSAQPLPAFRPALIGNSPDALINRIDEKLLVRAGQKNAAVMFSAIVDKTGEIKASLTYRATPDSKLLQQEVDRVLKDGKMIPAIVNHEAVAVFYYGTVTFQTIEGRPRLRIFANQEKSELAQEADFIGPQPYIGHGSTFSGLHYPAENTPVPVKAIVELQLRVDAEGNLQDRKVLTESPPLLGFGQAAVDDFSGAKFIPAFRNGQPVACEVTLPLYYLPE